MHRSGVWRGLSGLVVVAALLTFGLTGASAVDVQHGIGFTKGCASPTAIGQPYTCAFGVTNILDEAQDTLTINSLIDVVHASGGDVGSGTNILPSVRITTLTLGGLQSGATCSGGTGDGSLATPYTGVTMCTLPFNSRLQVLPFSHYTVQPNDFNLAGHNLRDDAALTWHDLCNDPTHTGNTNCNPNPPDVGAASLSLVTQLASSTATDIHNAAHAVVTAVGVGTTVHDFVAVTGQPGSPIPSGNVTIDWFLNGTCTGAPAATSGTFALNASGQVDATSFNFLVGSAGQRAFLAHYAGDATYTGSNGACEPLQVVDANIQITPASATNAVGTQHTLHCHININAGDGAGFVNAPAGTVCTVNITAGPGTPATQNCSTVGATGTCDVTITSAVTGTSTIQATTTVSVGGVSLTRTTGDAHAGDSADAQKTWVDANIQITPATADNPVATQHVLTITVNALNGTLAAGTATASIVSGPGSFVGSPTCNYAGGGTTASCTVTITSNLPGTTEVSATSNISVSGQTITRTTNTAVNTAAGGSGNALKNWTSLASGRVTGGGSIFATINGVPNVRVTHGFELRCTPNDKRQSLEINWDGGNNFHLQKIINSVICFDDPLTTPPPPPGTVIDTYAGDALFNGHTGYHGYGYAVGTGICNKQPAMIWFILTDAGEPGTADVAEYHIVGSGCTLDAGPAELLKGNHQFHKS